MKEPKPTFLGGLSVALLERLQVLGRDSFLGSIQLFSAVRQFSFKLRDAGFQSCNSQIKTAILSSRGELADLSINKRRRITLNRDLLLLKLSHGVVQLGPEVQDSHRLGGGCASKLSLKSRDPRIQCQLLSGRLLQKVLRRR